MWFCRSSPSGSFRLRFAAKHSGWEGWLGAEPALGSQLLTGWLCNLEQVKEPLSVHICKMGKNRTPIIGLPCGLSNAHRPFSMVIGKFLILNLRKINSSLRARKLFPPGTSRRTAVETPAQSTWCSNPTSGNPSRWPLGGGAREGWWATLLPTWWPPPASRKCGPSMCCLRLQPSQRNTKRGADCGEHSRLTLPWPGPAFSLSS